MKIINIGRRARIDEDTAGPGRLISPRVVPVAVPDRFQTTAFVSLGKGYIPDKVYSRSNDDTQTHAPELNIVKRSGPNRRRA